MKRYKIISWTAVIIWMLLIFKLSSQVADQSNQLSTGITAFIVRTIEKIAPNSNFDISGFHHLVRKNAHFIAYFILGILVVNALYKREYGYKYILLAISICIMYAISDELHQLVVPGRSGQVKDVLIDSSGAIVGIGLYCGTSKLRTKKKT